jgi:hypothetical protein
VGIGFVVVVVVASAKTLTSNIFDIIQYTFIMYFEIDK